MRFATILSILCVICWITLGVFALILPDRDWHVSLCIASFLLAAIFSIDTFRFSKDVISRENRSES